MAVKVARAPASSAASGSPLEWPPAWGLGLGRRHTAGQIGRRPRLAPAHAGTCCWKRVSTMCSAARSARATMVEVGLTPLEVTKQLPSTT